MTGDVGEDILGLVLFLPVVMAGMYYYQVEAGRQRRRLESLDASPFSASTNSVDRAGRTTTTVFPRHVGRHRGGTMMDGSAAGAGS